ncbi:MAG: hypothetical protein UW22_C0087G0003 [Candidatus Gottesmanbacteria bacterium GW2011_GWB1_44_11c]|uniref:Uncharacterized protein n=1 Tax=Candidatus Gottesmanbacteria bacterium GW2011_GWB1_44_11c TaxID=1618447 RepID=A0A0G1IQ03_9BACT|nr:MAG: hypothetical protein UW22_C0087G0003 [Candidatus Gottesmanbacteria bacterium GW2011_GWB1_44_11c]
MMVIVALAATIPIPGGDAPKNPYCMSCTTDVMGLSRHNHINLYGTTDMEKS